VFVTIHIVPIEISGKIKMFYSIGAVDMENFTYAQDGVYEA